MVGGKGQDFDTIEDRRNFEIICDQAFAFIGALQGRECNDLIKHKINFFSKTSSHSVCSGLYIYLFMGLSFIRQVGVVLSCIENM